MASEYDKSMKFPRPVFDKAWSLGLVNTHIPEAYGGLGVPPLSAASLGRLPPWSRAPKIHVPRTL